MFEEEADYLSEPGQCWQQSGRCISLAVYTIENKYYPPSCFE